MGLLDRLLPGRNRFERRYEIINYVARSRGFERYLELGISNGRCLDRVRCRHRVGVDPNPRCAPPTDWTMHAVTSDAFFAANRETFQLIFIDGLHHAEQVVRDIYNSLAVLEPGGLILLHDCDPKSEEAQLRESAGPDAGWNGDVWKAIAWVRAFRPELRCEVIRRDQGIGVLFPLDDADKPVLTPEVEKEAGAWFETLSWSDLEARRDELLGNLKDRRDLEALLTRHGR